MKPVMPANVQRHRYYLEDSQDRACVEEQRDARQEAGDSVVDDHEDDHYRQAKQACSEAELHRLRTER